MPGGEVPSRPGDQERRLRASRPAPGTQTQNGAGSRAKGTDWLPQAPPTRARLRPAAPGATAGAGPGAATSGPPPVHPSARSPTRAGGRTCSSTVLGVTFTVWRRPFGASTDTAEPPPPAGAAIFRSRDRGRLASNYFIRNSRDARPRGLGGGADWSPAPDSAPGARSRPRLCLPAEQAGALVPMASPKGLFGTGGAHCGQGHCPSRAHGPRIRHALETACKKAALPAASLGSCKPPVCHRVLDIPTP